MAYQMKIAIHAVRRRPVRVRDRVSDPRITNVPNVRDQVTDFARGQIVDRRPVGPKNADLIDLKGLAGLHHQQPDAFAQRALEHTHVGDDAAISIEFGIEDQRPQGRRTIAGRWRHLVHNRLEDLFGPDSLPGAGKDDGFCGKRVAECRGAT